MAITRVVVLLGLVWLAGCGGRPLAGSDAEPSQRDAGAPPAAAVDGPRGGDREAARSEAAWSDAVGWSLAVDDAWVYWTSTSGSVIRRSKLATSSGADQILAASKGEFATLAIDESSVYFTVCSPTGACSIRVVAKVGGQPLTLIEGEPGAGALVVDKAYLYWATSDGRMVRMAKAGGPPTSLTEATEPKGSRRMPHFVAGDEARLTWSAGGAIWSVLKSGAGGAKQLASAAEGRNPVGLAVADGLVTWAAAGEPDLLLDGGGNGFSRGELRTVSTLGGAISTLAEKLPWPSGVVVAAGDARLYFTSVTAGLLEYPAVSGTGVHLLENGSASHAIARDATRVYWSSGGTLKIWQFD